MIAVALFPLRACVFLIGWVAHWMEVAADWLVGARGKTEYVRTGKCKRCGRCCRCLALIMPDGVSKRDLLVRIVRAWHRAAMNFRYTAEEDGWLVYRCGYYREAGEGRCSIYPFRHRLCRFFPRQALYGHPNLHPDCGFKFVRRKIFERLQSARKAGKTVFSDELNDLSTPQ